MHLPENYVFSIDQCYEEAHKNENDDSSVEVTNFFSRPTLNSSQEMKSNHEAIFQTIKPRIKRRHSHGNYGAEVFSPKCKQHIVSILKSKFFFKMLQMFSIVSH